MTSPQKALVLGGRTGLLGTALVEVLQASGWVVAIDPGSATLNYTAPSASDRLADLLDTIEPDVVFNTIAYTQVDAAEDNPELAATLNRTLPASLGRLVAQRSCRLVHYSTDFVFDGKSRQPYKSDDPTNPQSVYGATKLAGEEVLLSLGLEALTIIRTAWLFGPGKRNFISTILSKCAEHQTLNVVDDQTGSPTYTPDLAQYSVKLLETGGNGIFHIVNSGSATWCDFATEAARLAQLECMIKAVPSSVYPQKALRPAYSVLDTESLTRVTGIVPRPWSLALSEYIFREFSQAD